MHCSYIGCANYVIKKNIPNIAKVIANWTFGIPGAILGIFKIISMQIMGYCVEHLLCVFEYLLIFGGSNSGQTSKLFATDSATYLAAFGGDKKLKNLKYV